MQALGYFAVVTGRGKLIFVYATAGLILLRSVISNKKKNIYIKGDLSGVMYIKFGI